jgi:thiosulfate/3-mercaptopyruvate sulfurtransferase
LRPTLASQTPLWTHNDWHASNLLWDANGDVESVLDFGLCDRTFALYDLATALERNAVPWLQLDSDRYARADLDIVDALLEGYHQVRPLSAQSLSALTAWLPVVHAEFALSEMAYFAQVLGNRESTDIAWQRYLLGHAQWFAGAEGKRLLAHIHPYRPEPERPQPVGAGLARESVSAATTKSTATVDLLVSTHWLAQHLHDPNLVILDATVLLPSPRFDGDYRAESGYPGWLDEHIPGSRHADLTHDLHDANATYSFAMPALEPFAAQLQRLGIDDHSRIVIHDRNDGFWAARLWWMLRSVGLAASILDGGLNAWRAAGQPIHSGPGPEQRHSLSKPTLQHQPGHWVDQHQVLAVSQGDAAGQLVCALGQGVFDGSAATRYHRRGHIPHSLNRPARQLFDEQGRYLPAAQLQQALGPTLLEGQQPLLLYCGGGISAAATAFALTLLGRANVMIYDGSLQQWSANPALPMTTGPTPA